MIGAAKLQLFERLEGAPENGLGGLMNLEQILRMKELDRSRMRLDQNGTHIKDCKFKYGQIQLILLPLLLMDYEKRNYFVKQYYI